MSNVDSVQSYMRAEAYYAHRHWERMSKELEDALDELTRLEAAGAEEGHLLVMRSRIARLREELAAARDEALRTKEVELAAARDM